MKPITADSERSRRSLALIVVGLALPIAMLIRLIPYEDRLPNFALAGALFLFAGARLRPWPWLVLPLLGMAAVDLYFLGAKHWHASPWVYGSYLVYALLARIVAARSESPLRIGAIALLGSIQFFLITNFGVWFACASNPDTYVGTPFFYSADFAGLLKCYEMGLPFFRGTLLGDLLFSGLLFGVYASLVRAYRPVEQGQETEAVR